MSRLVKLMEKRRKLIADNRALLDAAEEEGRELTSEEQRQYDDRWTEITSAGATIDAEQRQREAEAEIAETREEGIRTDPADEPGGENGTGESREAALRGVPSDLRAELRSSPRITPEYRQAFQRYLAGGARALQETELRNLQADDDEGGGYIVTPVQFVSDLIKGLDDMVFIRRFAHVETVTNAASLGVPTLESDPEDAEWTSELKTGTDDDEMKFGGRQLFPHLLVKRIKVSRKLLRLATRGVEGIVRDRLQYKFGITEEKGFLTGSGAQEPLGIFTASPNGISTARDVAEDNTATAPTFDGLISAKYALKAGYWNRARWISHRDVIKLISKIKDDNGQYIWRESVRVGEPDRILNLPVHMSEYAPNTLTANQYVAALGDFQFYWIADALDMEIQRLEELYAESNQVGFIGRLEADGMPVLEEAFVRVKLGS